MCCVRPGFFDAKASWFCCVSVLMAVDLPALERPTKAISGTSSAGNWLSCAAVVRKRAVCSQPSAARPASEAGVLAFGRGGRGLESGMSAVARPDVRESRGSTGGPL